MRLARLARNKTEKIWEKTMPVRLQNLVAVTVFAVAATVATTVQAQKKYDPGASDTEIKIGNIMPYSGSASAYGTIGKAQAAALTRSTPRAASTAARSTSSAMTTPSVRRKRPNRHASWWKATRCC
jgi:hypothetical protein